MRKIGAKVAAKSRPNVTHWAKLPHLPSVAVVRPNAVFPFTLPLCYSMCVWRCMEMRTNIVLDDELVKKALKLSKAKTKKGLVHEALVELIAVRPKRDLRELRGKIGFRVDYDYKALRKGRHSGSR